jgi:PKD repeat protein
VYVSVRNTGDEEAVNVSVDLYDGDSATGTLIASSFLASVGSGASVAFNTAWTATIGDHDLTMYLDVDGNVTEDSEANNDAALTVTVGGIPDARLEHGAFVLSTNMVGTITITADAFNGGNATASGYRISFYRNDPDAGGSLIGRQSIADIPPGGRATAQTQWSPPAGWWNIYARVENTDALDPSGNDKIGRTVFISPNLMAIGGPDKVAEAGQNITFNGSASWYVSNPIVNYTWTMGDSTTLYGMEVTHNYTNTGTTVRILTARLTVRDSVGMTDTDQVKVYINPVGSLPPTANAGTAPSGLTMEDLSFDGTNSVGTISTYSWDWGDGSASTGSTPKHKFYDEGSYTVSLVVISSDQLADIDQIQVTVSNRPPVVETIADIETDVGVLHDLIVMAYDEDGYIASYLWDFGDGSTSTSRDPSHTWTSDGAHQASVNVTDDDGEYVLVSFWVNVTDVVPMASFTLSSPEMFEGQTVGVDASGTVEPGDDIVEYEWDWDSDGTFDNNTGPVSSIVYDRPGWYNITLRVTDGEGSTNETVREVHILNEAPTASATLSPRTGAYEGNNVTFDASASDEPGGHIVKYYWDWDGDDIWDFDTTEPIVNHSYNSPGRFYPRLMVEDEDGTNDTYSHFWWLRVDINNAVPLINASESSGVEGENITVTVDADEPGNDLADFYWDFDRDGIVDAHTDVPYANWTWYKAGIFYAWVNVTDVDHTDTSPSWGGGEITVNVTDVAPKPFVEDGEATEGEATEFTVVMRGTEENISKYYFDLDGDGEYDVQSTTATTMLTFTNPGDSGKVRCTVMVVDTDGSEGSSFFEVLVHDVAPIVQGPALLLVTEGEPLMVEVNAYEPGMDIVLYEFDWNADGIVDEESTEPSSSHVYTSPGAYRLVVKVTDVDLSIGTVGIQVLVANAPPEADAGTPPQAIEGEAISLNASLSSEPGDDIVSYEWDYDGDGLFDLNTRYVAHMHTWNVPGVYTVILRVMDADGTFDEDMTTVAVVDAEPVADVQVTINPEDRPSVLDASGSYDPGGLVVYQWNITSPGLMDGILTTDPVLEYTFDRKVRYDITLTVTDHEGTKGKVEHTVSQDDVKTNPPSVTWDVPSLVMEGDIFHLRAWVDDPFPEDPELIADRNLEFTWNMGDGSPVRREGHTTHVYTKAALQSYEVWLTVIDEDDDRVEIMVANITVVNPAPEISPVEAITVKAGGKGETTIVAQDGTTPSSELTFTLGPNAPDWASLQGSKLSVAPGKGVDGATYMISVTVADELGAETTAQVPVVVTTEVEASGVSWSLFVGTLILGLLAILVLAILISLRMGAARGPPKEKAAEEGSYEDLYGDKKRRRVRPVAKMEAEKVDVDYGAGAPEETLDIPTPDLTPTPVPSPGATVPAKDDAAPPLPSWMTPSEPKPEEEGEFELEIKTVEAPPAIPSDWEMDPEPEPEDPYKFRRGPAGQKMGFKGAGKPRQ